MKVPRKRKALKGFFILLSGLILLPIWLVFAKVMKIIPTKVIRHRGDVLQTPVVFYVHPKTKRQVVFVAVIHIGEADYYTALQKTIDAYGHHAVLYEMVGKLTSTERESLTKSEQVILKQFESGKEFIEMAKELLGVTHQKEGLSYPPEWINTDIGMADLLRLFAERNLRLIRGHIEPTPLDKDRALFQWLLDAMLRNFVPVIWTIRLLTGFSSLKRDVREVILDHRNEVGMKAIFNHLQHRDVVTIWGAEHLYGMDEDLRAAGFREVRREWFDAYRSRDYRFRDVFSELLEEFKQANIAAQEASK